MRLFRKASMLLEKRRNTKLVKERRYKGEVRWMEPVGNNLGQLIVNGSEVKLPES